MRDSLLYLVDVESIDRENAVVSLNIFINYKVPLQMVNLDITFPSTMVQNLKKSINIDEIDEELRDSLIMIFRDCQNAVNDITINSREIISLTECKFKSRKLSTLGKPYDTRDIVYKNMLKAVKEMEKKSFTKLFYKKMLKLYMDLSLIEDFIDFCIENKDFEEVKPFLIYPFKIRGFNEKTLIKLGNIAVYFNDFETGERLFSLALKLNPSNPYALIGKAQCLYQQGEENFLMYLQKAYHFNKKITVEIVTKRFNFRKKNCSVFDVISLKEAMEIVSIPPEALENLERLSIPYRFESAKGSIYFIKSELLAWKETMDSLQIISKRFN
ncbi:hypothetical protein TTHT_0054 [Thermotomaculum hydrothermale]|uniref:Uncharacterized protein n=1 Tax=Thermotomaculum hydrothermale TaxID=981385 RepID=A0A7R6SXM3_9BACT|nr:tetratricopeptide repeat protein [Thermotomaculum hydrothermale]BBB31705.1 hypothetical protein TTHT_0054 [Thermotomaculum hydrothermale]